MYRILEPQYSRIEKQKAECLEFYREGYEQAVEKACMDAQEHCWIAHAEQIDRMSYGKRTERSPDFPDFEEVYNEEDDEWELSSEDQERAENFWDGWRDAHTKHYNKMIEVMESLEKKGDRNN